jgi:hypothetical protein
MPEIAPGSHICLLYSNHADALVDVFEFLAQAVRSAGRASFFGVETTGEEVIDRMERCGCARHEVEACVSFSAAESAYAPGGTFRVDRMLDVLRHSYVDAKAQASGPLHITGEMSWALVEGRTSRADLVAYEHAVNSVVRENPLSAICQYDASRWEPEFLVDIMSAHPYLLVDGMLVASPHFQYD